MLGAQGPSRLVGRGARGIANMKQCMQKVFENIFQELGSKSNLVSRPSKFHAVNSLDAQESTAPHAPCTHAEAHEEALHEQMRLFPAGGPRSDSDDGVSVSAQHAHTRVHAPTIATRDGAGDVRMARDESIMP